MVCPNKNPINNTLPYSCKNGYLETMGKDKGFSYDII